MKLLNNKYTGSLLSALCMFLIQSCDKDFKETNTNPDAVSTPTAPYIFSKALYDGAEYCGNTETLLLGTMQYTTSYNDVEGWGSKYVAARVDLSPMFLTTPFQTRLMK